MVEQIKYMVSIEDICNKYGYKIDNKQNILCPFHEDTKPSLKIYKKTNSFYCFACNNGGDAIHLVMGIFNIDFKNAIAKINQDFNLGINLHYKINKIDLKRIAEERQKNILEKQKKEQELNKILDEYRKWYNYQLKYAPKNILEMNDIHQLYELSCYWLPILDYEINERMKEL